MEFFELKNKISLIHVNGQWLKRGMLKEHGFLVEEKKERVEHIRPLLELGVPLVIEADFYPYKVELIEKEIGLLKGFKETKKSRKQQNRQ